jgi:hypothetical protein
VAELPFLEGVCLTVLPHMEKKHHDGPEKGGCHIPMYGASVSTSCPLPTHANATYKLPTKINQVPSSPTVSISAINQ